MTSCVVITGAAGELGRIVLHAALADPGIDHVIATSRRRPILAQARKLTCLTDLDLSAASGVDQLSSAVHRLSGKRLGLLHCAGGFPPVEPLHRTELSEVADAFGANTLTFIAAAQAVLPHMRRQGVGRLVAFTSHTQDAAYPFLGPFNLSKAALRSAVVTLANENARHGIAVNAIAVATLQTETERQIKPAGSYQDWVPVGGLADYALRLATTEQVQINGNELHYWGYSRSFFEQSVFGRNSIDPEALDPRDDR